MSVLFTNKAYSKNFSNLKYLLKKKSYLLDNSNQVFRKEINILNFQVALKPSKFETYFQIFKM